MKKILSLLLITIISFTITSCSNYEYVSYVQDVSYEVFDYYVIEKRQVVEFDYDYLEEVYDYDHIAYQIENDRVVSKTYYGHIKGEDTGKSLVKATLYKDGVPFKNLVLGYFVVVDYDSDLMLPISSYAQFTSLLERNNNSFFYLANDIEFPTNYNYEIIEEFNGVLINPYGFTISNVHNTEALFKTLDNAFIHGLIIENSSFTGASSAVLAKEVNNSYIESLHVFDTTVNGSSSAAGLVINSTNTVYTNVSFEGEVTGGQIAAGLIIDADNSSSGYIYYTSKFMKNSYAYADLTTNDSNGTVSGLVGNVEGVAVIESSYYVGIVVSDLVYPISNNSNDSEVYYVNVYTSISTEGLDKTIFAEGKIHGLDYEAFFYGTVLPGLEDFTIEAGKNPQN